MPLPTVGNTFLERTRQRAQRNPAMQGGGGTQAAAQPSYMSQIVDLFNQLPGQLPGWHQQAQNMFGQAGAGLAGMGNIAGQMGNWGASNPFGGMLMNALQNWQPGFNQGQFSQFVNQNNPAWAGMQQQPQQGGQGPSPWMGGQGFTPYQMQNQGSRSEGYYDPQGQYHYGQPPGGVGQQGPSPWMGGGGMPQPNSPVNAGGQMPQAPGGGLGGVNPMYDPNATPTTGGPITSWNWDRQWQNMPSGGASQQTTSGGLPPTRPGEGIMRLSDLQGNAAQPPAVTGPTPKGQGGVSPNQIPPPGMTGPTPKAGGGGGMPAGPNFPTPPQGGGWGVGLNQAAPMNTLQGFLNQQSNVPTPTAPQAGAGADFMNQLFGAGPATPTGFGGFGGQVEQARTAQLQNALSQLQAPGLGGAREQLFQAEFNPVQQAIQKQSQEAMNALSGRGMGRSTAALGNINEAAQQQLTNAAQQIGAGLTSRDIALQQQQRESGLGALQNLIATGQTGALGAGQLGQGAQQLAQQYNLGLGGLGLGTEELGAQTGLAMNQQQMAAQQQQFQQDNARAGLDLARYQTEQGFNMDQYKTDLQGAVARGQLDEQTASRMAQNALDTMGYGMQAQQMQQQGQQGLINALLGAGGQNLQALQGAGGLYGQLAGQAGQMGFGMEDLYRQPLQQMIDRINQRNLMREQVGFQDQGGGIGGVLGSLGGLFAGSALGPIGGMLGGYLGNQIFGGGNQPTGGAYTGQYYNPYPQGYYGRG